MNLEEYAEHAGGLRPGLRVRWMCEYERVSSRVVFPTNPYASNVTRYQQRKDWREVRLDTARYGWLVGLRTLNQGWLRFLGEDGTEWVNDGKVKAALVVADLHRNPVYVPRDAVTIINPDWKVSVNG